jgi:hypothetical protein
MIQRIATYTDFKSSVVETDFHEFMTDRGNLRKAWHCAGSLFHLHDWVYAAHKSSIDAKYTFVDDSGPTLRVSHSIEFANSLGQSHPDFQLVRGIANASKHFALKTPPPGRINPPGMPSNAANTYVEGIAFQPGAFQTGAFQTGDVMLQATANDIEFAALAKSVVDMWNQLFGNEGW